MDRTFLEFDTQPFSRNFDDEVFEDDLGPLEERDLTFQWSDVASLSTRQKKFNRCVIGINPGVCVYLHTVFQSKTQIAQLILPENVSAKRSPNRKPEDNLINDTECLVWSVNDDLILVTCQYKVTPERAHQWAKSLLKNIQAEKFFILDTIKESLYRSPIQTFALRLPVVRRVSTTLARNQTKITPLEAPNIVSGISAALLSQLEKEGKFGELFVSIEHNASLDVDTLIGFNSILSLFHNSASGAVGVENIRSNLKLLRSNRPNDLFL